ncbi:uncharacterized protein LOC111358106 [Spodoptera litura]|uniref:Uncharacterized protein LOC111358106 n=1 Tax=Spodoptera litura TaxID=69820 RepID=A0A9J7EIR8_SPOLT|nr:uncharacterized protein LOC111358106 [Spodoptera litura]
MNIFVLLCATSFFTLSNQQKFTTNASHEVDILGALQQMSKDTGIVLLTRSDPFISNASILLTDDESGYEQLKADTDDDFAEVEENTDPIDKDPKIKNILRWLPTRKPYKENYYEKKEAQVALEKEQRNTLRARQLNEERIAYVMDLLKDNFWMAIYMYGEVRRILTKRIVVDDIRQMIMFLEQEGNEEMKEKVLKCYRKARYVFHDNSWDKKANNLLVQVLKDPLNDNVVA